MKLRDDATRNLMIIQIGAVTGGAGFIQRVLAIPEMANHSSSVGKIGSASAG